MMDLTITMSMFLSYGFYFMAMPLVCVGQNGYDYPDYRSGGNAAEPNHCMSMRPEEKRLVLGCVSRAMSDFFQNAGRRCRTYECRNGECNVEVPVAECPRELMYDTCDTEMGALQDGAQFICSPTANREVSCDPYAMLYCLRPLFRAVNKTIPGKREPLNMWSILRQIENGLEYADTFKSAQYCKLNLTYTNMLSCVNRTSASIWESCSSEAVLGGYSEMIRERFSPWMDTIYDKLMYTKKVIQHADHICNLGVSNVITTQSVLLITICLLFLLMYIT